MLSGPTLDLLRQMARGVAAQFGSNCEVVIHDLTGDLDHTVACIENGHVSGRKAGDGPSKVVLDLLRAGAACPEDRLAYLTRTPDGKVLRSSSLFIPGPDGRPAAIFSINYDISTLVSVEQAIRSLTTPAGSGEAPPQPITSSVTELLEELIRQSVALVGKPVALMDREDKRRAIRFLSDSGALLITKAGDRIAAAFGISKFTLYNYLDDSKG